MASLLDQIKSNSVPAAVMRTAANGALPLPAGEMLEVLVYLTHNPVFRQDAKMTLAKWDVASAIEVMSDPAASPDVLGYFWLEENRRPALMPRLLENPAISENMLMEVASSCPRTMAGFLLASPRARSSPAVIEALSINPALTPEELQELQAGPAPVVEAQEVAEVQKAQEVQEVEDLTTDPEILAAHQAWYQEHAAEIAAEEDKPFELTGKDEDEAVELPAPASPDSAETQAAAAMAFQARAQALAEDSNKLSSLQKIARMKAADRVKLAFSGNKEERSILIRDGARIVQISVLASPKLTDPEVETFASAKNLTENVLREIARNRRFMKNYNVVRNLVNNPKCPLDLSLTWVKMLHVYDLKSLRQNKNVPDTIRQVAFKLYREKSGPSRESKRS